MRRGNCYHRRRHEIAVFDVWDSLKSIVGVLLSILFFFRGELEFEKWKFAFSQVTQGYIVYCINLRELK